MPSQNATGLDMFVGSGLDYLPEVSLEDLDTDLLSSNISPNLGQDLSNGFTPLAASLGTFGPGSRYMLDPYLPSVAQLSQLPFMPAAGNPPMPSWNLGTSASQPAQPFGLMDPAANAQLEPFSHADHSGTASGSGELNPGAPETMDAKAKIRDKNKRAQKRFRERKKERAQETEKQMTDLTAEMETIQAETKKLEERNQLLEKVLSLNKIEAPAPSRGPLELTPDTLKTRCNPYGAEFEVFPPDKVLPVSVLTTQRKAMTVQEIKDMSWEQHVLLWKAYCAKLATLLSKANGDPESEAGLESQSTVQEAVAMCSVKAMYDPYGLQHFYIARMEEARRISKQKTPSSEAMAALMAKVLGSLGLSDQQKQGLLDLRQWVLPQIGQLMRERERLSTALQSITKDGHKQEVLFDSKRLSDAHVQAADILTELYSNLKEDSVLSIQMSSALWRKLITPFQLATIAVETYPWVPDTGALLNQLAAEDGQPSAVELLGFGEFGVHASNRTAVKTS